MKVRILLIAILVLAATVAATVHASPYLVCDPQPAMSETNGSGVEIYELELDGTVVSSPPQDLADGTVRLHHDLAGIATGSHSVRVRAGNKWGWSDWTTPFLFEKALPQLPTGLSLED